MILLLLLGVVVLVVLSMWESDGLSGALSKLIEVLWVVVKFVAKVLWEITKFLWDKLEETRERERRNDDLDRAFRRHEDDIQKAFKDYSEGLEISRMEFDENEQRKREVLQKLDEVMRHFEEHQRMRKEGMSEDIAPERMEKDVAYYEDVLQTRLPLTRDQLRHRYFELAQQYHPDKVAKLGPELKELAEKKMKEINEAYEFLKKCAT